MDFLTVSNFEIIYLKAFTAGFKNLWVILVKLISVYTAQFLWFMFIGLFKINTLVEQSFWSQLYTAQFLWFMFIGLFKITTLVEQSFWSQCTSKILEISRAETLQLPNNRQCSRSSIQGQPITPFIFIEHYFRIQ